jgi:N-carbamoyl-L-amino-acid hydrolase
MNQRHDAMVAASQLTLAVRDIASRRQGRQVGTVGRIEIEPNSPNVIPGRATLSVEFRDLSDPVLKELGDALQRRATEIARETGTTITMTLASTNVPAMATSSVQEAIARAAAKANLPAMKLPSGAGHDAQQIARIAPMGMIFVPSAGGVSHSPKELTTWEDCARGADVLLKTVLELDQKDSV